MATYVIGDIQGCFSSLTNLLDKIQFNPNSDVLWFTGDLVNRGPQSLEVLRFIKNLGEKHRTVLGNHDLHLLAVAKGARASLQEDTLQSVLTASDRDELLQWLSQQPLFLYDESLQFAMVHAGVARDWDLQKTLTLAKEVEAMIQDENTAVSFFKNMYGNEPAEWQDNLNSWDRLRCITNYLTRARFCDATGRLFLSEKGTRESKPNLIPWFRVPERKTEKIKIVFGHWAALSGVTDTENAYAIDTGCVWGFCLTAMRLEDGKRVSVPCPKTKRVS